MPDFCNNNRFNQNTYNACQQQPVYYQQPAYCMPQNCIPAEMAMPKTLDQKLHLAQDQKTVDNKFITDNCKIDPVTGAVKFNVRISGQLENILHNSVESNGAYDTNLQNLKFNDHDPMSGMPMKVTGVNNGQITDTINTSTWRINASPDLDSDGMRSIEVILRPGNDAFRITAGNNVFVLKRQEIFDAIMAETSQSNTPPVPEALDLPPVGTPQDQLIADDLPQMYNPPAQEEAYDLPPMDLSATEAYDLPPMDVPEPEADDLPPMDLPTTETEADNLPSLGALADDLPMFMEDAGTSNGSESLDLPPLRPEPADPFRGPDGASDTPLPTPASSSPGSDQIAQDLPRVDEPRQTNYQAQAKNLYDKIHTSARGNPTYEIVDYISRLPQEERIKLIQAYNELEIGGRATLPLSADLIRTRQDITPDQIEKLVDAMRDVNPQANKLAKELYVAINEGLVTYDESVLKLIADNSRYAGEAAHLYQDFYGHKQNIIYEAAKNTNQIQRDLKAVLGDVEYGAVASYFNMDRFPQTNVGFSSASYAQQLFDCFPTILWNNQDLFVSMVGALKLDAVKYNAVNAAFNKIAGKTLEEFEKGYTFTEQQNAILNAPAREEVD